ncbi:protein of unknown function DUF664 [Beutenbergia cavernae DSM 12333]|uniref:Mini-circle protein n=1 Tax=Beutenbergia cavernae (strain ATCC BAA-8 / DSM 12333 / CCUG 43141 / JCM 11478 / NBRC 16432 / NCIMB 13614 / HKI 0122) TaxID=471853 RepID=C5BWD8_BEUC1|nr:DinB family protein [Beutenbergia cavernae]ACQ78596.1 protein of unknown function DUF664 [Beutenbergia cavernae DSM 12333]
MTSPPRLDPPQHGPEAEILLGFLDFHRRTLQLKTDGLDAEQLNRTLAPSSMTLGGLLKHLAYVEDNWFSVVLLGNDDAEPWRDVDWGADRDWEWHSAALDDPEELRALHAAAVEASERIVAGVLADDGLDRLSVRRSRSTDEPFSLRWILVHMIEEYCRHNGHADLIRESIDGAVGE